MSKRGKVFRKELLAFLRLYARKAPYGRGGHHDPNDRRYNQQLERLVKSMKPEELDELMHDEDEQ